MPLESERLSRKDREREQRRAEIIDAAERVFIREGYHGATVEAIAHEADFGTGTLYNFFKGKDDLYAHVIKKLISEFLLVFDKSLEKKLPPEEMIRELVRLRLDHFENHRAFFRIAFEAAPGNRMDPPRSLPQDCRQVYTRYLDALTEVFQRGMDEGLFVQEDPRYLAISLEGVINAFISYWSGLEDAGESEGSWAVRSEKVTQIFLRHIRPPQA